MNRLAIVTISLLLATNGTASADGRLRITPSASATTVHETNLFSTAAARQSDFVMRMTSAADGEYRSTIWTFGGRCSIDAERFTEHPALSTFNARRHAELGLTYAPTRRLTIGGGAELSGTQNPGELNRDTGLAFTRAAARRTVGRGSVTRQFDRETTGTIAYSFTNEAVAESVAATVHDIRAGAERQLSSRNTGRAGYRLQEFSFSGNGIDESTTSVHTLSIGITRSMTRQTAIAVDVGPQLNNGRLAADILAALQRHTTSFDYRIAYARTQGVVFGLAGTAATDAVSATGTWILGRALRIHVSPSFSTSRFASARADVSRVAVNITRILVPNLALDATVDAGIQHGTLFPTTEDATIPHRTIAIRIVASPSARAAR